MVTAMNPRGHEPDSFGEVPPDLTGDPAGDLAGDPARARSDGEFLRALALRRRMRQESYQALAQRTGIPRSTLADMLAGRRRPRPEVVEAVVGAYAADPGQARQWVLTWQRLQVAEPGTPSVATPAPVLAPIPAPRRRRVLLSGMAVAVAVLAGAVVLPGGAWGTFWPDGAEAAERSQELPVYNVEAACRPLRTQECGLGVVRDPHAPSSAANRLTRVWHGDRLILHCVTQGRLIVDEEGMSTDQWYRVSVPGQDDLTGWFPGIRLRVYQASPACAEDVSPASPD
ncbi:helix-turn-helix domain-containing protein [Kineosporia succinea]|uniref:Transcriptional regulator with XRE-family HTH domain n=1 Tax=Kineosporia succinea TaxID=84632 RepID=A0ABT9P8Y8_9ACTN|nr:helix-turn-helix transcriptional regulator [Kineosporia succinea]MDP9828630.1 transcriptional regulator with XRE-family HTH domain [Kineosporia succinea]